MAAGYSVSTKFIGIDAMSPMFKKISSAGKTAASGIGSAFKSVNGIINSAGGKLLELAGLAGGVYAIKSAIQSTISAGLKFEQTMVNAAAKFGNAARPGTQEFLKMTNKAKEIGLTTEFTATQAAEAFRLLGAAGFNAGQTIAASSGLMDMATAAEIDLNQATIASANSLATFNLKTQDSIQLQKNMARVSDVMVAAVNAATLETEDYLETMKTGGPAFASLNRPIEEFAAMTAILAESGIKGSMAGTTLKNAILRLIAPVGEGRKALKALGINAADANGELKPMQQIIQEIANAQNGQTTTAKAAAINAIFGRHAVSGMLGVMQKGPEVIGNMVKSIEGATGVTQDMATMMRDTSEVRIKLMQSAIEGLQLSIFEGLKPVITDVTSAVGKWSSEMSKYFEENPGRVKEIVDMTLKIGQMVIGLYALAKVVGIVNALMLMNPWVAAIYLIIGSVALLAVYFDDLKLAINIVAIAITAMFTAWAIGFTIVTGGIGLLIGALVAAFALLIANSETIRNALVNTFKVIGKIILTLLVLPILTVLKVLDTIAQFAGIKTFEKPLKFIKELIVSDDTDDKTKTTELVSGDISKQRAQNDYLETVFERNTTTKNMLLIRDETGRAEMKGEKTSYYQLERTAFPSGKKRY